MSKTSQRLQAKRNRTIAIRTAAYKSVLGEPHKPVILQNKKERATYDNFRKICTEQIDAQRIVNKLREQPISDN